MFGSPPESAMPTVLLADEPAIVRRGFSMILAAQSDFRVIAEVSNGREEVEQAEKPQPELCVMDASMPDLNGIEATRRLLKVSARTRVAVASRHKDAVREREILRAGGKRYELTDCNEFEFSSAVRAVSADKGDLSPEICDAVCGWWRQSHGLPGRHWLDALCVSGHQRLLIRAAIGSAETARWSCSPSTISSRFSRRQSWVISWSFRRTE
jgi:CheY-like chemotaxis protein